MELSLFDVSKRDIRDATRLALQSAGAAAAMFTLMQACEMPEKFVGVLSAVLVVQPSVGNTLVEATNRFVATLVGSVIGVGALLLLPGGYGTAAALALSMLAMNAVAAFRPEWRYGVVAAVALSLRPESGMFDSVQDRAIAIGLGALIGAAAALLLWPDLARSRAERNLRRALAATAERLDAAVERVQGAEEEEGSEARRRYHLHIDRARQAADGIRLGDTEVLEERIHEAEELYNSVLILNRVARAREPLEDSELHDRIDAVRSVGCEVVRAFSGGHSDVDEKLDELRRGIDEAHKALESDGDDPPILDPALVFAFDEVESSLRAYREASEADEES